MPETTLVEKFQELDAALCLELIERSDVIDSMLLALVAGKHHFQLGGPGIAKSRAVTKLMRHIGGLKPEDFFHTLLTKFSVEDQVMGPVDLMGLREGHYRILPHGYLPMARYGFVDEGFKGSAALLNAMLMLLNERQYVNDGRIVDSPLHSCFMASNEMPEGEELNALFDRLHFRTIVKDIQEPGNFIRMLNLAQVAVPGVILDADDIEKAHHEAMLLPIDPEVTEALSDIRSNLFDDGIYPSSRRFADCMQIMQAHAWLQGREKVLIEDTVSLTNVLWTAESEAPRVQRLLIEFASPFERDVLAVMDIVDSIASEVADTVKNGSADTNFRSRKGVELHKKMKKARTDIERLSEIVTASGRRSKRLEELDERAISVLERIFVELFAVPAEMARSGQDPS